MKKIVLYSSAFLIAQSISSFANANERVHKLQLFGTATENQSAVLVDLTKLEKFTASNKCYYITADHGLGKKQSGDLGIFLEDINGRRFEADLIGRDWGRDVALLSADKKHCKAFRPAKLSQFGAKTKKIHSAGFTVNSSQLSSTKTEIDAKETSFIPRPSIEQELVLSKSMGKGVSGGSVSLDKKGEKLLGMLSHRFIDDNSEDESDVQMLAVGSKDIWKSLKVILDPSVSNSFIYNYFTESVLYKGIELLSPLLGGMDFLVKDPHGTSGEGNYGVQVLNVQPEFKFYSEAFDLERQPKIYSIGLKNTGKLQPLKNAAQFIRESEDSNIEGLDFSHYYTLEIHQSKQNLDLVLSVREQVEKAIGDSETKKAASEMLTSLEKALLDGGVLREADLDKLEDLIFMLIDTSENPEFLDLLIRLKSSEKLES